MADERPDESPEEKKARAAWGAFVEAFDRCFFGSGWEGTAGWAIEHARCAPAFGPAAADPSELSSNAAALRQALVEWAGVCEEVERMLRAAAQPEPSRVGVVRAMLRAMAVAMRHSAGESSPSCSLAVQVALEESKCAEETCGKAWGGGDVVHRCVLAKGHQGPCALEERGANS